MKCKFNDCGWCYSKDEQANDNQGACKNPQECVVNIEQNGGKMNSIETLKRFNEWRRGSDTEMQNLTTLGKAIDTVIADFEAMQKQNDELRAKLSKMEDLAFILENSIDESADIAKIVSAAYELPDIHLADIRAEAVESILNLDFDCETANSDVAYSSTTIQDHANRIKEG